MSTSPALGPLEIDSVDTADIANARKTIRSFLRQPVAGGGTLLVVGPRGAGKSRLVDECLNDRKLHARPLGRLGRLLFGEPERSKRLRLARAPRDTARLVVPVPVSPFPDPAPMGPARAAVLDPRTDLLGNLVFGLTNALDPHLRWRRQGKTLPSRLGWADFWFSSTGLSLHQSSSTTAYVPALCIAIFLWAALMMGFGAWLAGVERLPVAVFGLLSAGPALVFAWFLLRWLDWRALKRSHDLLYNLTHADNSSMRKSDEDAASFSVRPPTAVTASGAVSLGVGLLGLAATVFGGFQQWLETWLGGLLGVSANGNAGSTSGAILPGLGTPALFVILTAVGLLILVSSRSYHRQRTNLEASFSASNPAWTINLLRRHLYLLHRCGIEPVLVVDELDKLEAEPSTRPARRRARGSEREQTDALDDLLFAFTRLKESLGTEFLWILIGGPEVWYRVKRDREKSPPGPLATVMTKTVVVGPTTWQVANPFLARFASPDADERILMAAFLNGRGYFALMLGVIESGDRLDGNPKQRVETLIDWLTELDDPKNCDWLELLQIREDRGLTLTPWRRAWLRAGIMDFAYRLLTEPDAHWLQTWKQDQGNNGEILKNDDHDQVSRLGGFLFFQHLTGAYGATQSTRPVGIGPGDPDDPDSPWRVYWG